MTKLLEQIIETVITRGIPASSGDDLKGMMIDANHFLEEQQKRDSYSTLTN